IHEKLYTLAMRGNEVFRHAVRHMQESAISLINRTGIAPENVALVIPHQANLRIINAVTARIGIPPERVFVNLQKYGNTSGAACAIALDEAVRSGRAKKGDIVLMVTFGAGLTWSSAAIRL
ncbi:MAG: 3-oxoacyl-ACP synthase, partial [Akkermansia muciniphila]|nr:3-oxoacyl-ACP synthase [Akkermansia muciniphila]